MRGSLIAAYGSFLLSLTRFPVAFAWETSCESFALQDILGVNLINARYYEANSTVNITTNMSSIDAANLPAFCRVQLLVTTNATANSTCYTEVWLPDEWTGRYLTVGDGGFAGGVNVGELALLAVAQGFAGVSTDTGHVSTEGSGSWALNDDNAIIDWGWRALHLSIVAGKEIVKQYYGQDLNKSYYIGCSTVSICLTLHSLKEVQSFPDDFDGVIVGSPANRQTYLQDWGVRMSLNVLPVGSPQFINASTWEDVIHPEVLKQCDALDGLADGIINDPRICNFRPETLTCRPGQDTATCLTLPQIDALHKIYSDYYEANQTYIFGPYYPGGEAAFPDGLVGNETLSIALDWFRNFVTNDSQWTIDQYNPSLIALAEEINPGQANAVSPNLTAFAGSGRNGKLLQYVGWADQLISPSNSIHYYESVHAFMISETDMETADFYRLYTVPGMNHWLAYRAQNGYGANAFGSVEQASTGLPPLSYDPEHNILAAMVRWVEDDIAPTTLNAVYYNDNQASNGIGFVRPICQYPQMLRYNGGNQSSPDGFDCM
ncbi:feruloyl esterase-like protein [Fomitopsis serialis]|uniref:feruloyl esterase-like protein n=1 Tax=Fomitopsis serialis TaxID=139415 RepID=UPI002007C7C3|nr:feruloyl esterase-like protein [Neoantrodia serialis]KAH9917041.1 feruloyl esterase-like protein [Neoantrodia serialis]